VRGIVLAFIVVSSLTVAPPASAGASCDDGDNPMATSEGFGISRCAMHGRRYHIDDFAGERVRGYVRHTNSDDPMAWSDDEWRTDLMSYSNVNDDRYDRRFHHVAPLTRVVQRIIHVYFAPPIEATIRTMGPEHGASLKLRGSLRELDVRRAGPLGHSCPDGGILVLRWTGYGERASCMSSRPMRRSPPKGVHVFPGRA